MKIKIYQINAARDKKRLLFTNWLDTMRILKITNQDTLDGSIYDCVFDGECITDGLEEIYMQFNTKLPAQHDGRSLSVSDVIEVIESNNIKPGFYFCDSVGFKPITFDPTQAKPYNNQLIRVVMVEPGKKAYVTEIGTRLQELYDALGCECIQTVYPYEDTVVLICDDEGKIRGSQPNRAIYGEDGEMIDIICGTFCICDCSTTEFKSLPDEMIRRYLKLFEWPENFVFVNGKIEALRWNPDVI